MHKHMLRACLVDFYAVGDGTRHGPFVEGGFAVGGDFGGVAQEGEGFRVGFYPVDGAVEPVCFGV
jgi:hypothetical protein